MPDERTPGQYRDDAAYFRARGLDSGAQACEQRADEIDTWLAAVAERNPRLAGIYPHIFGETQ